VADAHQAVAPDEIEVRHCDRQRGSELGQETDLPLHPLLDFRPARKTDDPLVIELESDRAGPP